MAGVARLSLRRSGRQRCLPERALRRSTNALRWLDRQGEQPVFLFLNYMDAHKPYNTAAVPQLPEEPPCDLEFNRRIMEQAHLQDPPPDPSDLAQVLRWYDLGIANLDRALGRLFEELRARDRFDDALIIVTSDYGEYFGEHALYGHSKDVYEEPMAIPLLVKAPGQRVAETRERRTCGSRGALAPCVCERPTTATSTN